MRSARRPARCWRSARSRCSRRVIRSRARRRLISSLVSPGPRPPMPPVRRDIIVFFSSSRGSVLELRQLDLQLAVAALRVLREDVEDQHRAIDDLQVGGVGDRARLAGRQIGIEDQHLRVELHRAHQDLLELAAADEELGIRLGPALVDHVEHAHAGGAAELAQLRDLGAQRACGTPFGRRCTSTTTSTARSARRWRPPRCARSNCSSSASISAALSSSLRWTARWAARARAGRPRGRHQVRDVQIGRPPVRRHDDRGDQVEPEQREVDQVVARERLAAQVRVHQAQAAEAAAAGADAAEVGQHDARGVADDDVLDVAAPIDEHADLAIDLARALAQERRQLARRRSPSAAPAAGTSAPARASRWASGRRGSR